MYPRAKKEKAPKRNSPFKVIIRWFTEAKQYLVAFSASIVAFGVLQGQIARIDWTNWVADTVAAGSDKGSNEMKSILLAL